MPIRELQENQAVQECAACGTTAEVSFSSIFVGAFHDGNGDSGIIPMPICAACGAIEYLVQSRGDESQPEAGTQSHLHRLLVDLLHARLVGAGRVVDGMEAGRVETREPAIDVLETWFGDGLKVPSFS